MLNLPITLEHIWDMFFYDDNHIKAALNYCASIYFDHKVNEYTNRIAIKKVQSMLDSWFVNWDDLQALPIGTIIQDERILIRDQYFTNLIEQ